MRQIQALWAEEGVDGAIHRAGGSEILNECRTIRKEDHIEGLPAGQAVATTAGKLPSKYVIHTVGPVWHGGSQDEEKLLRDCYINSLGVAARKGCKTVAFPAISTGVYRFPKKRAAVIASEAVKEFLGIDTSIDTVIFVFFSSGDEKIFLEGNSFG